MHALAKSLMLTVVTIYADDIDVIRIKRDTCIVYCLRCQLFLVVADQLRCITHEISMAYRTYGPALLYQ